MPIRDTHVVAIEGTYAAGKTTLVHALVSHYRERGAQLTSQLRAARHHTLLIIDKTLINVVAYARLLLPPADRPVLDAMQQLCKASAGLYDAVFYASDLFDPRQEGDRFRDKVADQQAGVNQALRVAADQAGLRLIDIPQGLSTRQRVDWITARLAEMDLLSALT